MGDTVKTYVTAFLLVALVIVIAHAFGALIGFDADFTGGWFSCLVFSAIIRREWL